MDTDDINIVNITELKVSNYSHHEDYLSHSEISYNVPSQVFLTRQEYGNFVDYSDVNPVQDGKNVIWVAQTTTFDGFQNYSIINNSTLSNLFGANGRFYGIVFYQEEFYNYDNDFTVEIRYTSGPANPSNLQASVDRQIYSVILTWDPVNNPNLINEYQVFSNDNLIRSTILNRIVIYDLPNTKDQYTFKVKSLLKDGTVSASTNSLTVDLFDVSAPSNLTIGIAPGGIVFMNWVPAEEPGMVGSYLLYVNGQNRDAFPRNINSLQFNILDRITDAGMNKFDILADKQYKFKIKTIRPDGSESRFTNEVEILPSRPVKFTGKFNFNYDLSGRLSKITHASTGIVIKTYQYDNNGNLMTKTN
ncbi:RHS repeat domain-containing protein [Paenibacillus periandrae]|uniref:RHS repeat domain-containing protein n=1 Tax=Paenibacillus periandrae TaxID=1761741 RepID=UPI001F09E188|nr:RHS repeat domain-containing protein [Paenibacillus periandrae]